MDNKEEDIYKVEEDDEIEASGSSNNGDELKSKLVKYGIIIIVGLIVFVLFFALITSCTATKSKKTIENELTLKVGEKQSFTYTNYTWTSTNPKVAIIGNDGKIEALSAGDTDIVITTDNEIVTYKIHIEELTEEAITSVKLEKNTIELEVDKTYEMTTSIYPNTIKNYKLIWYSSDEEVATVENGIIKAKKPGTCMVTVKTTNGNVDTCLVKVLGQNDDNPVKSIEIDSIDISLTKGSSYTLSHRVEPEESVNLVTWESSNEEIATAENGVVYALAQGDVKITAKSGKVSKTINVKIVDNEKSSNINQNAISLKVGETYKLTANDKNVKTTWISSDTSIATVDAEGTVTAKALGKTTITAKLESGTYVDCEIEVISDITEDTTISLNTKSLSMNLNDTARLVETVSPSNNVSGVTWESSDPKVVTVENGLVTAVGNGTAKVTAKLSNGKSAECDVTVSSILVKVSQVKLNASSVSIKVGGTSQLTTKILPEAVTDKTIKWKSANTSIATVDENGKVTAVKEGKTIIYATASNGVFDNCLVAVTK